MTAPLWPDEPFLKVKFFLKTGKRLNLKNPRSFNEKLQWLKLYDQHEEYTRMVDKVAAKDYVASIIGEEYIIPTYGVYNSVDEIDFDALPNQFVLKVTHDSGGIVVCRDKKTLNIDAAKQKLGKRLKHTYVTQSREYQYKDVPRRIIAEKYLEDEDGELKDYKVLTFNGEPKIIEIDYNRFKGHLRNLYTTDWEKIDAVIKFPSDEKRVFDKPKVLDEMLDLSRRLAKGTPHIRTDFYIVDNKIFFGELTFFHGSGMEEIIPESMNETMGGWIQLPIDCKWGGVICKDGMYVVIKFIESNVPDDYKVMCFDGKVRLIELHEGRYTSLHTQTFYDRDWKKTDITQGSYGDISTKSAPKPAQFENMVKFSEILSEGIPHIRVDWYIVNGHLYFGELTFFDGSGMVPFDRYEDDLMIGSWIPLPMQRN